MVKLYEKQLETHKEFEMINITADVRKAVEEKAETITAYVIGDGLTKFEMKLGDLTDDEREIILKGCLINYYRG